MAVQKPGLTRAFLAIGVLIAAAAAAGCVGPYKSNFSVVVVNKAVNAIQVIANGNALGQVASGQSASFSVQLTESNANEFSNGVAPTPQGQITITAKDVKTGILSAPQSLTLSANTPTYITFAAADFPPTVPTVATFSFSPATPGPNQDVTFNASASTPNTGTFSWNFGDGATGSGVTVTHAYPREGAFNVTLTVTGDSGISSTASRTVPVTTGLPPNAANFTFSPTAPGVNQDVFFNASTSNVGNGTFSWDFGDGTTGTGVTITHRFSRANTYTVVLRATNSVGQSASISRTVSVSATSSLVVASFTFSPINPGINQDVFFNASASTPANGTFNWNFGDGTTGTGALPTHRYARAATYNVTLTVANDVGQSSTTSRTVTVTSTSTQVVASFTFSPTNPGINQQVFFSASASVPSTGTFAWTFGDGSSGTGIAPVHQYGQTGTYTVTMTVTNEFQQSATTTRTITVTATSAQVTASFTFSPTTPGINQDVFFNASASNPNSGTFAWGFGDGSSGSGITATHQYSFGGTYTVTLTVTSSTGQSATTTRIVPVSATVTVISAAFTFSPTDPTIASGTNTVLFDATPSSASAIGWTWDFGDGSPIGSGQRTSHAFTRSGTWIVRLTVADASGRTATTTNPVTVCGSKNPTTGACLP